MSKVIEKDDGPPERIRKYFYSEFDRKVIEKDEDTFTKDFENILFRIEFSSSSLSIVSQTNLNMRCFHKGWIHPLSLLFIFILPLGGPSGGPGAHIGTVILDPLVGSESSCWLHMTT